MPENSNMEMEYLCKIAVKTAKERFSVTLDYSVNSLSSLEKLLDQAHNRFNELAVERTVTDKSIRRTSMIWGSYLGEIIRRVWGGNWAKEKWYYVLKGDEYKINPIQQIYLRITSHPTYSICSFYDDFVEQQASSSIKPSHQTRGSKMTDKKVEPETIGGKQPNEHRANPTEKATYRNRKRYIILGIVSILLVCLGSWYIASWGIQRIRKNSYEQNIESKDRAIKRGLERLLVESDKLVLMTEQGVSYDDYLDQLNEVRRASISLNFSWKSAISGERESFGEAIRGWNLALRLWEYKRNKNIDHIPTPNDRLSYDRLHGISDYLGEEEYIMEHISIEKTMEYLFAHAHQHLETFRKTISYRLK